MTRTGKFNTVKKIIEATAEISAKAQSKVLLNVVNDKQSFTKEGAPQYA